MDLSFSFGGVSRSSRPLFCLVSFPFVRWSSTVCPSHCRHSLGAFITQSMGIRFLLWRATTCLRTHAHTYILDVGWFHGWLGADKKWDGLGRRFRATCAMICVMLCCSVHVSSLLVLYLGSLLVSMALGRVGKLISIGQGVWEGALALGTELCCYGVRGLGPGLGGGRLHMLAGPGST
jgi:hypothetical protein